MSERPFTLRFAEALANIERDKVNPRPVVLEGFDAFAERQRLDSDYKDPVEFIPTPNTDNGANHD